jgi:hypothetical protein
MGTLNNRYGRQAARRVVALGLACAACANESASPTERSEPVPDHRGMSRPAAPALQGEREPPAASVRAQLRPEHAEGQAAVKSSVRAEVHSAAGTGSSAPSETAAEGSESSVVNWKKIVAGLPSDVLVGTDVAPLASFLNKARPIPATGTFTGDQGGAESKIRLTAGAKGPTLTREFAEPGADRQVKRYENLKASAGGARLSGKLLEVIGVGKSILVFEKASGVDGIPDSLWVQYDLTSS